MTTAIAQPLARAASLTVETVRGGLEAIDALRDEWSALCDAASNGEPFNRPEWIRAYLNAFVPNAEVVLVTIRAAGRLAGILPLVREIGLIGGLPARKLRAAGNTHTCRYELLQDGAYEPAIVGAVWSALLREPGWDVVELENAPGDGALARLGTHAAAAGYPAHALPSLTPPYLDLVADGDFDRVLTRVDSKFRSNLRRRRRKLEGCGHVALVYENEPGQVLERFYGLERESWKGEQGSAIASNRATRAFYDEVARVSAQRGTLALYALELDGRAVAIHFGLYERQRYYLLKTTYDEGYRACSPGQLLTHDALRDLVARGCTEFDFLGGQMEWKADWAPRLRPLTDIHIFRGSAGRALHALRFRVRPAVARAVRRIRLG
jgi:CelD/BcsL family acetyltransferase involved in cellulose biosynthesis